MPYSLHSKTQTDTSYHIKTLASVYTPVASKIATQTYLSELKEIAKQTGKDFAAVLRQELSLTSEAVDSDNSDTRSEDMVPNSPDIPEQHVSEPAVQVSLLPSTAPEKPVQPV